MREMLLSTPVTGIFICLAAYELGVQINKKLKTPIANPMLIGIVLAAGGAERVQHSAGGL